MKSTMLKLGAIVAAALCVLAIPTSALLAEAPDERMETTLTGRLSQNVGGEYVLVEEESGDQIRLAASDELGYELEDHVGSQVKVAGEWVQDSTGEQIFQVSKVERTA